jgi:hypothetical protein
MSRPKGLEASSIGAEAGDRRPSPRPRAASFGEPAPHFKTTREAKGARAEGSFLSQRRGSRARLQKIYPNTTMTEAESR